MAKKRLVIDSSEQGQFFLLVEGGTVTIGGSRKHADTVLDNLRVARIHCELEVEGDPITVRGDESGASHALQQGEVVQAVGCRLRLEIPSEAPPPPVEPAREELVREVRSQAGAAEEQGLLSDEELGLQPMEEEPAAAPVAAPRPEEPSPEVRLEKRLHVFDGADQGRFYPLPQSGSVILGKDRKHADIILHDLYVARVHCLLEIEDDKVVVIDREGTGRTLINGQKVSRQEMNVGDVLRIGNSHLRLEVAVVGQEFAKVAGPHEEKGLAVAAESDSAGSAEEEVVELTVAEDESDQVQEEEGGESLPAGVSDAVRQLYQLRDKLLQLSGHTFGHYQLGPVLGRGRCAVVFQADDLKTGQKVALKVFSPLFPHGEQELQRFARVMKAMLTLRHPNLVGIYGAGKTGAYTWIAREYMEGESLVDVIQRQAELRRFDWHRANRVLLHVGQALEYAHKHHLRHGKVLPANILIQRSDKTVKLADLMLGAALEGSRLWQANQEYRPTAELVYLAPEQTTAGTFVDQSTDLYNLGAVVYALLTGRSPFLGDTEEDILEQINGPTRVARPRVFNSTVPAFLERVAVKLLAKQQEDRYQTASELLADLEPIEDHDKEEE
jgi:pSer/pThr/pTyr-binding forkhead associated (FHA) protein